MDERNLDCAIDAAAGAMMTREPGRSLGYNVLARVRETDEPAPRRLVWITAVAGVVLCGGLAIALMSRPSATIAPLPPAVHLAVAPPPVTPRAPVASVADALPTPSATREPRPENRVAARAPLPQSDISPIEPIRTEPIVLSSIDVPQLEREATAIDTLTIEPLTIEPLAASND